MTHVAVDPYGDRPIYQQVADELRARIKRGELGPGQKLPSERELSERYGTARLTARRALQVLVAEGLVRSQRGVGVFVRPVGPIRRVTSERSLHRYRKAGMAALALEAEQHHDAWRRELLYLGEVPAPPVVAARLGVDQGAPVFARRRRLWAGPTPMQYADSYYRPETVAGTPITRHDSGPDGGYAALESQGIRLTRFTEELSMRMPTPEEARGLRLSPGVPVADLVRVAYSGDQPVEVFVAVMAGDRHVFVSEFPAG